MPDNFQLSNSLPVLYSIQHETKPSPKQKHPDKPLNSQSISPEHLPHDLFPPKEPPNSPRSSGSKAPSEHRRILEQCPNHTHSREDREYPAARGESTVHKRLERSGKRSYPCFVSISPVNKKGKGKSGIPPTTPNDPNPRLRIPLKTLPKVAPQVASGARKLRARAC